MKKPIKNFKTGKLSKAQSTQIKGGRAARTGRNPRTN